MAKIGRPRFDDEWARRRFGDRDWIAGAIVGAVLAAPLCVLGGWLVVR